MSNIVTKSLASRMISASIASCDCGCKTHVTDYHDENCRYRVLTDARETLDQAESLIAQYAARFREYEALHAAKPDMAKAERNAAMAAIGESFLATLKAPAQQVSA